MKTNNETYMTLKLADSIFDAMMQANAIEDLAPQDGIYGMLSNTLKATIAKIVGDDMDYAEYIYEKCIESGERPWSVLAESSYEEYAYAEFGQEL